MRTRSDSGRPLASTEWLETHHRAKLPERTEFGRRLAALAPQRVVDLGCGPGLWLQILDDVLPAATPIVGVDADGSALDDARRRLSNTSRHIELIESDVEDEVGSEADLVLAFNVFPYIQDLSEFLRRVHERNPGCTLCVRQYDGGMLRIGPMAEIDRVAVDASVRSAVGGSREFRHFDLDRVFAALAESPFGNVQSEFEVFQRFRPFPVEFEGYYEGTLDWTRALLSEAAAERFDRWRKAPEQSTDGYFVEVDLVAWLS